MQRVTETIATHAIAVYDRMEEVSVERNGMRIFTGSLAEVIKELGISMTYYSRIFRLLYDHGYCALGDRGGRAKPSTVLLLRRPERDELLALTTDGTDDMVSLVTRLEALESSIGGIHVVGALKELERRIQRLEDRFYGKK